MNPFLADVDASTIPRTPLDTIRICVEITVTYRLTTAGMVGYFFRLLFSKDL